MCWVESYFLHCVHCTNNTSHTPLGHVKMVYQSLIVFYRLRIIRANLHVDLKLNEICPGNWTEHNDIDFNYKSKSFGQQCNLQQHRICYSSEIETMIFVYCYAKSYGKYDWIRMKFTKTQNWRLNWNQNVWILSNVSLFLNLASMVSAP